MEIMCVDMYMYLISILRKKYRYIKIYTYIHCMYIDIESDIWKDPIYQSRFLGCQIGKKNSLEKIRGPYFTRSHTQNPLIRSSFWASIFQVLPKEGLSNNMFQIGLGQKVSDCWGTRISDAKDSTKSQLFNMNLITYLYLDLPYM